MSQMINDLKNENENQIKELKKNNDKQSLEFENLNVSLNKRIEEQKRLLKNNQ